MKQFKFTIHAEFILDEQEVFADSRWSKMMCAETARQEFLSHDRSILRTMQRWNLDILPKHVTVEDVSVRKSPEHIETGAWRFED